MYGSCLLGSQGICGEVVGIVTESRARRVTEGEGGLLEACSVVVIKKRWRTAFNAEIGAKEWIDVLIAKVAGLIVAQGRVGVGRGR